MDYKGFKLIVFCFFCGVVLAIAGCGPKADSYINICRDVKMGAEVLDLLETQSKQMAAFQANGQCILQYYQGAKSRPVREKFDIKLWVLPPDKIYMQGDISFDGRGIVLGANKEEFWFSIKPQISSYWWGRWSPEQGGDRLIISPMLLLDGIGIADVSNRRDWSVLESRDFFVAVRQYENLQVKKIYVDKKECLIKKIEYLDRTQKTKALVKLDKYRKVSDDFFVPSEINIYNFMDGRENLVRIELSSIKQKVFSPQQQSQIFSRPEPRGFENVYRLP